MNNLDWDWRERGKVSYSLSAGDCALFMTTMIDDCFVDLTITSPPYDCLRDYKGYDFDFEAIARQLYRVTKDGGVVVWICSDQIKNGHSLTCFKQALYFQETGFQMHDVMIYQKLNTPFVRQKAYTNCFEYIFVLARGNGPKTFNRLEAITVRQGMEMLVHNKGPDGVNNKVLKELKPLKTRNNIWAYAVGLGGSTNDKYAFEHPAIFPEKLAEEHILSWSNPGDMVMDPMCGSGTTGKMALKNNRSFIGVDISENYIGLTRRRIENSLEQIQLF